MNNMVFCTGGEWNGTCLWNNGEELCATQLFFELHAGRNAFGSPNRGGIANGGEMTAFIRPHYDPQEAVAIFPGRLEMNFPGYSICIENTHPTFAFEYTKVWVNGQEFTDHIMDLCVDINAIDNICKACITFCDPNGIFGGEKIGFGQAAYRPMFLNLIPNGNEINRIPGPFLPNYGWNNYGRYGWANGASNGASNGAWGQPNYGWNGAWAGQPSEFWGGYAPGQTAGFNGYRYAGFAGAPSSFGGYPGFFGYAPANYGMTPNIAGYPTYPAFGGFGPQSAPPFRGQGAMPGYWNENWFGAKKEGYGAWYGYKRGESSFTGYGKGGNFTTVGENGGSNGVRTNAGPFVGGKR